MDKIKSPILGLHGSQSGLFCRRLTRKLAGSLMDKHIRSFGQAQYLGAGLGIAGIGHDLLGAQKLNP